MSSATAAFQRRPRRHEVSQSSASQAVNMLERRLGCKLIDRSKRPFELTPAGQIYYDEVDVGLEFENNSG